MPSIRARGGMLVLQEKEKVALGAYASRRAPLWLSKNGKKRMRKLTTRLPSTPAMKDGSIFHANVDNIEDAWEGVEVEVVGASNPTLVTASPSRISSDGNLRATSLLIHQYIISIYGQSSIPLVARTKCGRRSGTPRRCSTPSLGYVGGCLYPISTVFESKGSGRLTVELDIIVVVQTLQSNGTVLATPRCTASQATRSSLGSSTQSNCCWHAMTSRNGGNTLPSSASGYVADETNFAYIHSVRRKWSVTATEYPA